MHMRMNRHTIPRMITHTDNMPGSAHANAEMRLLHLVSPALPIGGYSYSQGVEWAVDQAWLTDIDQYRHWLTELIHGPLQRQELPLLVRLYHSCDTQDAEQLDYYSQLAVAVRETAELRNEERDRAGALLRILKALPDWPGTIPETALARSPLAGMAWATVHWRIPLARLLGAYAHTWLESQIVTAIKLIPLGQTQGQQLQYELIPLATKAIERAWSTSAEDIGFSTPAVSMASARHETQYSRIYRS